MAEEKKYEQFDEGSYAATPVLSEHANGTQFTPLIYIFPHFIPPLWKNIKQILHKIRDSDDLNSIKLTQFIEDIHALHYAQIPNIRKKICFRNFQTTLEDFEHRYDFLKITVKKLAQAALLIEDFEIMQIGAEQLVFSQQQILTILASMFFCIPHKQLCQDELPRDFSMARLLKEQKEDSLRVEKIRCLLFYFYEVTQVDNLNGQIKIFRRNHPTIASNELCKLYYIYYSKMEEFTDHYIVDFANKKIGGGVLGNGAVQEEILFLCHPELIALLLFTPQLEDNEALIVEGVTRFIDYSNYGINFEVQQVNQEKKKVNFICIDAINYSNQIQSQYTTYLREILKARVGFAGCEKICTGKWGCGVFQGDWQLKLVIQWIAASKSGCKELLFVNDDESFVFNQVFPKIKSLDQLENILITYCQLKSTDKITCGILEYIAILDDTKQLD